MVVGHFDPLVELRPFSLNHRLLVTHSTGVYLQVQSRPFRQVLDFNVELQPTVPQHLFIEGLGGRPLLQKFIEK